MKWAFWTLVEVSLRENFRKKLWMLWRLPRRTLSATKFLRSQEDTLVEIRFICWQEFWEKDWKMESHVTIWMSPFITVLTAIWWMVWVLRTAWTNFIRKLIPNLQNQVESTKHTIQLCLVWLAMVWTSSQRISTPQLKWRSVIGCVFRVWEPTLTDQRATSTEWEAQKKLLDGTPNFTKSQSNKSMLKGFESFDLSTMFLFLLICSSLTNWTKLKI